MNKQKTEFNHRRRTFVKQSAMATAGVTAAAVLPGTVQASVEITESKPSEQKGYQVTKHVLDYYKTAAK